MSLHPGFVHQWEKTASQHCFRPIVCIPLLLSPKVALTLCVMLGTVHGSGPQPFWRQGQV